MTRGAGGHDAPASRGTGSVIEKRSEEIMRHICHLAAVVVTIASAHPGAHAQFARQEIIAFQSDTTAPDDFLAGKKGAPVNLAGHLRLPKAGPEKQPAVVFLHGAGGVRGSLGPSSVWADVLNKEGIATFAVDSFAGRGVNTPADVARLHPMTRVSDAFAALEVLAKHPLIDARRIAVMGFSHGSVAALLSNQERFQTMRGTTGIQFAAHISVYGLCFARLREDEISRDRFSCCTAWPTISFRSVRVANMQHDSRRQEKTLP